MAFCGVHRSTLPCARCDELGWLPMPAAETLAGAIRALPGSDASSPVAEIYGVANTPNNGRNRLRLRHERVCLRCGAVFTPTCHAPGYRGFCKGSIYCQDCIRAINRQGRRPPTAPAP